MSEDKYVPLKRVLDTRKSYVKYHQNNILKLTGFFVVVFVVLMIVFEILKEATP